MKSCFAHVDPLSSKISSKTLHECHELGSLSSDLFTPVLLLSIQSFKDLPDIFGRRRFYVIFAEWSTNWTCIVRIFFQRAKLHSGRRWFTNWNPDRWYFPRVRERCRSCGGRSSRWKQIGRAPNFPDFNFQGARKRPIRKSCNAKDRNASKDCHATRTSASQTDVTD